jgi:hypothetical protein
MNFGLDKQMERVVEVLALSALMRANPNKKVEKKLREIAFPLSIDFQNAPLGILEGQCPKCNRTKCNDGTLPALTKNEHGIWCTRCQEYLE